MHSTVSIWNVNTCSEFLLHRDAKTMPYMVERWFCDEVDAIFIVAETYGYHFWES